MTRRVWRTDKAGDLGRLKLQQESLEGLDPNMVRVRVKAVGLNFADLFALTGLYSATPEGSFIPGLEFSGMVESLGAEVDTSDFDIGQRVMGCIRFGGYAEVVDVAPAQLRPMPSPWSFEQGAAFLVQTLTAWYALTSLGNVQAGQRVLVHSAAGGVGLQAMAICRQLGALPMGTVGKQNKVKFLKEKGFEDILVRQPDFAGQLKEALKDRPLHLVLDGIGGQVQLASFEALAPTGRLVVFGAAEFTPGKRKPRWLSAAWSFLGRPKYDALIMIETNRSVMAFNLIWLWQEQALLATLFDDILRLDLGPAHVGKVFSFEQAHEALQHLRSGTSMGKVVLLIS